VSCGFVTVSVWPPGSNIYPGECMLLRCSVVSGSRSVWTYQWFRNKPHMALTPNPRHLASHDSYSITGVTREDGGSYCVLSAFCYSICIAKHTRMRLLPKCRPVSVGNNVTRKRANQNRLQLFCHNWAS
uniref:Ig-like domain-containing protein n=1 Tax=Myripristis murdjan TaxID=586833 RepID=A0A667ZVL9_9TELE